MPRSNLGSRSSALKIFGGSSHPEMTKLIARKVGARVGEVVLGRFANRETQVELKECVRGQDIYVVQVPSL
jgi:ribose-phosphate pyrophosphokinase